MDTLTRLEKLLEWVIEKPFERLFKPRFHLAMLAPKLAETAELARQDDGRGGWRIPHCYQVWLSQADYQTLPQPVDLEQELLALKRYLRQFAAEANCYLNGDIQIEITVHPTFKRGQMTVTTPYVG